MKLTLYYKLLIFHVILAIGVFTFRPLALGYFLFIIFFFSYKIFNSPKKHKAYYVLLACAYVVGIEVFLRMNDGTFFYEASKYLIIFYILLGMFSNSFSNKSLIFIIYILLLIPGIFVAVSEMGFETNIRKAIAFNLSGPVCLGVSALFCYKRNITFNQIKAILLAFFFPLVTMSVYLVLYTPDLQDVVVGTESNFATSGGFGPNQVATVLGIGIFVIAVRFFMSKEAFIHRFLDLIFLSLLGFRALVTFSRGGVITAIIMILGFLSLYYLKVNLKARFRIKFSLLVFFIALIFIWLVSSVQTSGFLEKRYANQDAAGRQKEDITTGRTDLIAFEFGEFLDNPFLGIGVGKVKEERLNETGVTAASHNEMTRIIAEHGLFGVFAFLILLITPLIYRLKNRNNIFLFSFYLFWLLTINHSAMRIAAPAFIYALCLLNITYKTPGANKIKRSETHVS
ncbi:O-antigen ligase family protein [Tamlana sp. 2201CG12-4]|uniref:O-antigen ligase family protein n=1 Tax=Tamlana sp. 2201CG12-4 TaxID=3112582 RepID=UPI002DBC29CF|nr:O-antigen ligase family protein [Tamlana sp. 2201CG12-4]MEC3907358.1 O-antigen ligase family protein [Tamlana sp. 2201CG12-4]